MIFVEKPVSIPAFAGTCFADHALRESAAATAAGESDP
jgi:hypothetical protein